MSLPTWDRLSPHTVGTRGKCHTRLTHVPGHTGTYWGVNTILTCKNWCVSYRWDKVRESYIYKSDKYAYKHDEHMYSSEKYKMYCRRQYTSSRSEKYKHTKNMGGLSGWRSVRQGDENSSSYESLPIGSCYALQEHLPTLPSLLPFSVSCVNKEMFRSGFV